MTWCTFHRPGAVNVEPRTDEGIKGCFFPLTSPALTERKIPINGACRTCTKFTDHGPPAKGLGVAIPFGEGRYQRVDAGYPGGEAHPAADTLYEIFSALWLAHYCANGVPFGYIWNVGATASGDNISQQIRYQIISAAGNVWTLKGRNPKFIPVGTLRQAPGWTPASGPPRLTPGSLATVLMPGSMAVLAEGLAQRNTNRPYIVKVNPPVTDDLEDVTFTVEMSNTVEHSMTAEDARFPPGDGKYYVEFFWEAAYPWVAPNFQVQFETQFSAVSHIVSKAALEGVDGIYVFKDSDGNDTRVLFPLMMEGAMVISYRRVSHPLWTVIDDVDLQPKVQTVQSPGPTWVSSVDLTDWMFADLIEMRIAYRPQAVASDTFLLQYAGNCANAQLDRTLSYVHHGGRRCMNTECDQFSSFQNQCWQPNASEFCLGGELAAYHPERVASPKPSEITKTDWMNLIWNGYSWIFFQMEAGVSATRNFGFTRGSGPSIAELLGVFRDRAPGGKFPTKQPLNYPRWGRRNLLYDDDGNRRHEIKYGAYISAEPQNAGATPILGSLNTSVSGWVTKYDQLGNLRDLRQGCYPSWNPSGVHEYTYAQTRNGLNTSNRRQVSGELFAISVSPTEIDRAFSDEITTRFS